MIHKADINRLAKKVLRYRKGVRDHQIIHPVRDWFIGVGACLCLIIAVGYWSVTTYFSVSTRSVEVVSSPTTEVAVYRADLVQAALAKFGERSATYEELLTNRIMPSLPNVPPEVPVEAVPSDSSSTTEPVVEEEETPLEEVPSAPEITPESEGVVEAF